MSKLSYKQRVNPEVRPKVQKHSVLVDLDDDIGDDDGDDYDDGDDGYDDDDDDGGDVSNISTLRSLRSGRWVLDLFKFLLFELKS